MVNLSKDHPEITAKFIKSNFTVHKTVCTMPCTAIYRSGARVVNWVMKSDEGAVSLPKILRLSDTWQGQK